MEFLIELGVGLLSAIIGAAIAWWKKTVNDLNFEDLFSKYSLILNVSGAVIEELDPKLYIEMKECIDKLRQAYASPEFTTKMFNTLVKESMDVFERVDILLANRG